MKVYRADTGDAYDVGSSSNSTVASVKSELVSLAGVEAADQILLFDKYKLDDSRTLASYNLPSDDKPVFLFSRKHLKPGAAPPKETVLGPVEVRVPPEPPVPHATGLVGALLKYQHQFLGHLNFAKAVLVAVDSRIALSRRCCAEQDMQIKALEAAIAHLHEHYRQVPPNFEAFREYYLRQKAKHENLLETFESDLSRLREVALHPALRSGGMQTLMDVVSEARLRKWAEDCQKDNDQLSLRLVEVEQQIVSMQREVDSLTTRLDVNLEGLKEGVKNTGPMRQEVASTKASFSKDHKSVSAKIEDLHRGAREDGSWEVCDGFDSMKTVHLQQLDRLTKIDSAVAKVMAACAESKTKLSGVVHARMQSVAVLEARVRDVVNKFLVLREALTRQQQAFSQLFYVRYLPDAYRAALEEVVRRKAFGKQLMATLAQFAQRLARMRDDESKQRETFLNKYGRYIPKNLIPGLPEELPDFVSAIGKALPSGLDKALPAIEPPESSSVVPLLSLGSLDSASPPNSLASPRTSGFGDRSRSSTEMPTRVSGLESENARLKAEIQGLRRDRETRERTEKEREREKEERRRRKEKEMRKGMGVDGGGEALYRSPFSSPSSSSSPPPPPALLMSSLGSGSLSVAERKRVEESYQQRILSLEEKLAETYRQASLADQARETSDKKVVLLERELRMMRETLALMEGRLKESEASANGKPSASARRPAAGSSDDMPADGPASGTTNGGVDTSAAQALRAECEDMRARIGALGEENRLLVSTLRETHETLMAEQSQRKQKDEELETVNRNNDELRERVRALEVRKVALEEELDAARTRFAAEAESQRQLHASESARVREEFEAREASRLQEFKGEMEAVRARLAEAESQRQMHAAESARVREELEKQLEEELEAARARMAAEVESQRQRQAAESAEEFKAREASHEARLRGEFKEELEAARAQLVAEAESQRQLHATESARLREEFEAELEAARARTAAEAESQRQMHAAESARVREEFEEREASREARLQEAVDTALERDGLRARLITTEAELENVRAALLEKEEASRELTLQLERVEAEKQLREKEQAEKEAEVARLRVALEEEKVLLSKSLQEKDEQLRDMKRELAQLREEAMAKAEAEAEALKREYEIAELKRQLEEEKQKYEAVADLKEKEMSESTELNMRMAKLYSLLDLKDRKVIELTNSSALKEDMLAAREHELESLKSDLALAKKELKQKKKELRQMQGEVEEMRNVERTLELLREESDTTKRALEEKISELSRNTQRMLTLSNFKADDLACFVYTSATGFYEAFNVDAPNHFLSQESLMLFPETRKKKALIIGQIVFVVESVATAAENPYKLAVGTKYFEVTITKTELVTQA